MPISAATVASMESLSGRFRPELRYCRRKSMTPTGIRIMPTTVMSLVRESIMSDFVERTSRRASASFAA